MYYGNVTTQFTDGIIKGLMEMKSDMRKLIRKITTIFPKMLKGCPVG